MVIPIFRFLPSNIVVLKKMVIHGYVGEHYMDDICFNILEVFCVKNNFIFYSFDCSGA
jgi:hypothetical protein